MKRYLLVTVAALILVGRTTGYAEFVQNSNDSLAADTIQLQFSLLPDSASGSLGVQADIYLFNDGNTVSAMSLGFRWDNLNMIMDSVVASPEAEAAFDFILLLADAGNVRVSNETRQFLFAGVRVFSNGLAPSPTRKLLGSYFFTMNQWTTADSIAIDTAVWSGGSVFNVIYNKADVYRPFLLSSIVGFDSPQSCCTGMTGNIDMDPNDVVDMADLTLLIDHLFINFPPLPCVNEADVNQDGNVDIGDQTELIDHLFINYLPLADCP